jgi:DNA polymerase
MSGRVKDRLLELLEEQAPFGPLPLPPGVDPRLFRHAGLLAMARAKAAPSVVGQPESAPLSLARPAATASGPSPAPPPPPVPAVFLPSWKSLEEVRLAATVCRRCELGKSRTCSVFGVGSPTADLVIVGEAPGEQEDLRGEPFVGAAGQLLDKMLAAIGFARQDVYICNTLKCRPPINRDPLPGELAACRTLLDHQLHFLQPKLMLALGRVAARALLGGEATLAAMRGREHLFNGRPLRVSYHPAALLRNQQWKRPAWEDLQALQRRYAELGGRPGTLTPSA